MDNNDIKSSGTTSQVIGWFVQVTGTVVMLLGVTLALGALPEVINGRFIEGSDFTPFFILLVIALAAGFGLMIVGGIVGAAGRMHSKRESGQSQPLREVLGKPQKAIGLMLIFVCFVALLVTLIQLVLSLRMSGPTTIGM